MTTDEDPELPPGRARWPNVRENPGPPAPGRYCLAVCYCGDCDHWKPAPPVRWWPDPDGDRRERW